MSDQCLVQRMQSAFPISPAYWMAHFLHSVRINHVPGSAVHSSFYMKPFAGCHAAECHADFYVGTFI